jgi:FtsP/CotA-like multicopper oxidase with cupredoxin domain
MQKNSFIFVVLGLVLLAGLFLVFKPQDTQAPASAEAIDPGLVSASQAARTRDDDASSKAVPEVTASLKIEHGRLQSGPGLIHVVQGQTVRLTITSDQDAELHLHGYDLKADLRAGQPTELTFLAVHSGRFEYELHGAPHAGHDALGVIEVLPK